MPAKAVDDFPCEKMNTIPENEYFTNGTSDEFIDAFAIVDRLNVTSKISPFYIVGKSIATLPIILKHRLSTFLQASARLAGNAIAIIAQWIYTAIDFYFWPETSDRKFDTIGANE
tara:strand:+ start:676 stop:1020 length:345 start_codon:yes stop_codon:yes gene_type:complete